jgi:hypothetical protein
MRKRVLQMLQRNVDRGVAYLNANPDREPGFVEWYKRIKLADLQMASGSSCIIGQALNGYSMLAYVDDQEDWPIDKQNRWAIRHGFLAPGYKPSYGSEYRHPHYRSWADDAYGALTAMWREAIRNERVKANVSDNDALLTGIDPIRYTMRYNGKSPEFFELNYGEDAAEEAKKYAAKQARRGERLRT